MSLWGRGKLSACVWEAETPACSGLPWWHKGTMQEEGSPWEMESEWGGQAGLQVQPSLQSRGRNEAEAAQCFPCIS